MAGQLLEEEEEEQRCSRDKAALAGKGERGRTRVSLAPCWEAFQAPRAPVRVARLYPRAGTLKHFCLRGDEGWK